MLIIAAQYLFNSDDSFNITILKSSLKKTIIATTYDVHVADYELGKN